MFWPPLNRIKFACKLLSVFRDFNEILETFDSLDYGHRESPSLTSQKYDPLITGSARSPLLFHKGNDDIDTGRYNHVSGICKASPTYFRMKILIRIIHVTWIKIIKLHAIDMYFVSMNI